jgi:hypothetical protein
MGLTSTPPPLATQDEEHEESHGVFFLPLSLSLSFQLVNIVPYGELVSFVLYIFRHFLFPFCAGEAGG